MKKLALAIILLSTASFSVSAQNMVTLYHVCHSNSKASAEAAIAVDGTGLTYDWLINIIRNGGCDGTSYCQNYVPEQVAGDIQAIDAYDSFEYSFHHWEW